VSKDEMRAYLKLLSAVTAAEDLLSELQPFGDIRAMLQDSITSAETFLPPSSYAGIDPSKLIPLANQPTKTELEREF